MADRGWSIIRGLGLALLLAAVTSLAGLGAPSADASHPPSGPSRSEVMDREDVSSSSMTPVGWPATGPATVRPFGWPDQLTEDQMRWVLGISGWRPELHDQALRVFWVESEFRPKAQNPRSWAIGLAQIHPFWWYEANFDGTWTHGPFDVSRADDPVYNLTFCPADL